MKYEAVVDIIGEAAHMPPSQGKVIYDYILKNDIKQCLELGFAHGTSSCYIAAALHEKDVGHLKTIDHTGAKSRIPNIYDLLKKSGLERYVEPVFANTSYTWELMKIIDEQTGDGLCKPLYDFCFIDGAHSWETDGMAFFLVAKLLKPEGWILFDDLNWTFDKSPTLRDRDWVKNMPEDQRCTPQIEKVFNLLVRQHPEFEDFRVTGNWGWAKKQISLNSLDEDLSSIT